MIPLFFIPCVLLLWRTTVVISNLACAEQGDVEKFHADQITQAPHTELIADWIVTRGLTAESETFNCSSESCVSSSSFATRLQWTANKQSLNTTTVNPSEMPSVV